MEQEMGMISDDEIRSKFDAKGNVDGVVFSLYGHKFTLTRYEAFRFSRFLENAILESCRLSGEKIDEGFAK
jgi:hypothetical protein